MQIMLSTEDLNSIIKRALFEYEKEKRNPFGDLEEISKNTAEKIYGSSTICRWILEGRVKPIRLGTDKRSKLSLKIRELEKAREQDELDTIIINKQ